MNIYATQQDIVKQLQSTFDELHLPFVAKDLPEAPSDYTRALVTPIAYVVYTGSNADNPVAMPPVAQVRRLSFSIEIHARQLYGANGLFAAHDIVEQALIGYMPVNAHQIYLKSDEVSQIEEALWVHILKIECDTRLVQRDFSETIVIDNFQLTIDNR